MDILVRAAGSVRAILDYACHPSLFGIEPCNQHETSIVVNIGDPVYRSRLVYIQLVATL